MCSSSNEFKNKIEAIFQGEKAHYIASYFGYYLLRNTNEYIGISTVIFVLFSSKFAVRKCWDSEDQKRSRHFPPYRFRKSNEAFNVLFLKPCSTYFYCSECWSARQDSLFNLSISFPKNYDDTSCILL